MLLGIHLTGTVCFLIATALFIKKHSIKAVSIPWVIVISLTPYFNFIMALDQFKKIDEYGTSHLCKRVHLLNKDIKLVSMRRVVLKVMKPPEDFEE